MDCDDCLEKLYAFLDQELGAGERKQVATHLDGCADCGDNLAFEERFLKVVSDCGATFPQRPLDLFPVTSVDICDVSVSI
jgi:mycothiol system anti-sigma-R factor